VKVSTRHIVFTFSAVLVGFAANAFTLVAYNDSVYVNGQPLRIVADVEVDSLVQKEKDKWDGEPEWSMFIRGNAVVWGLAAETDTYHKIINHSLIPELGADVVVQTTAHFQLHYRLSASLGLAHRFDAVGVDSMAIGFERVDGELLQILVVPDDLQNEADTAVVPLTLIPNPKVSLGLEWHGVMRKAKGWRFGATAEWTPVRNQITYLYKIPSDNPDHWTDIDHVSTFSDESLEISRLHLRVYAGWSPWSSDFYGRGAIVLSPNRIEASFALGYHL
jgi:hypothetical protein